MEDPMLRADCARCAALCCVGLAFDRSVLFALDKAAGEVCPHLTLKHRCAIHPELATRGFTGCTRYDCLGAGQRVTQELFGGRSWHDDPSLLRPMLEAFRVMREVHECQQLLLSCQRLALTREQELKRSELQRSLQPSEGWSPKTLEAFEHNSVVDEIQRFLVSLKARVRQRQGNRTLQVIA
jgi:hypothetical protein